MNSLCLTRDDLYRPSEDPITEKGHVHTKKILCKPRQRHVTIDVLPDNVLLNMFDYYLDEALQADGLDAWHTLVHVSRKWRCVVFDSPRRLNLELLCSSRRPVREMLTDWPPLSIMIWEDNPSACNGDNIIAALEHHNRVSGIQLRGVPSSLLEKLLATMQEPFPALTHLGLETKDDIDDTAPVIPGSFLGGFAPDLRTLSLTRIPISFPALRKLLLFTTNLVELSLSKILLSEYFSPDAMVTCLSVLTRLEYLNFGFKFRRSRPYREKRRPPPRTRTLLPALRHLSFAGVSEYLEDLMARIDAPLLSNLDITFIHQLIFDTPQLAQFISRRQKDEAHNEAHVSFSDSHVHIWLPESFGLGLELGISCKQSDWQLSAVAQVCSSSFPQASIPTVEHLYIREDYSLEEGSSQPCHQDDIENSQWLELLHPFTAVKNLYLSQKLAPRIAPALQELVGERVNEVLPALQSIFWEELHPSGVVPEGIRQFVKARTSHPIGVIPW